MRVLIVVAMGFGITACSRLSEPSQAEAAKPQQVSSGQRFILVPGQMPAPLLPGALALDTETGKLCKTYSWNEPSGERISSCGGQIVTKRYNPTTGQIEDIAPTIEDVDAEIARRKKAGFSRKYSPETGKVEDYLNGEKILKVEKVK